MNPKKTITLKFQNWDKHQVRKDYRRPHWFALSNDFALDSKLFEFTSEEKLCLIFLLCEASKQNKLGEVEILPDHWCRIVGLSTKVLMQTVEKIESVQIAYRSCTESERYNTIQYNTIQYSTVQNTTRSEQSSIVFPDGVSELSELWQSRSVKPKQLETMLQAFPEPAFIMGEARKAVAWEEANPARRKKDFARFLNNWLARAWDSRRVLPQGGARLNTAEQREANNRAAAEEALRMIGGEE
jgi:hypothetical protein